MENFPTKRYRFKFSPLMLTLCILGIVVSAGGLAYTTYMFVNFLGGDLNSPYEWIKFALLYGASIALFVLLVAMLIKSEYVVTDKELIVRFGLIRQKYAIKTFYSVHLFRGMNKLTVYFDDFKTKYVIIAVKEAWYDDFVRTLMECNERIAFSFSTAEEEEEVKRKKK